MEVGWWWKSYRPVEGLGLFPSYFGSTLDGVPYLALGLNHLEPGGEEMFQVPEGHRILQEQLPDTQPQGLAGEGPPLELEEIESGVFRVPGVCGDFAPFVIALEEAIVVVDAPASFPLLRTIPATETDPAETFSRPSERLVDAVRARFPGRELILVLCHAHEDHVGGVRSFVAAGATVMASPEVAPQVEALVALPAWVVPDRLSRTAGARLRFVPVTGRQTLGTSARRLELIPATGNRHALGMLVAYLPESRLVFVSDLVTPEPLEIYPP